jgi:hypothetical protein
MLPWGGGSGSNRQVKPAAFKVFIAVVGVAP